MRAMTYLHIEQHRSFSILPVLHAGSYRLRSTPTDGKRNLGPGGKKKNNNKKIQDSVHCKIMLFVYSKL